MMAALASSMPLLPWRFAAACAGSMALALLLAGLLPAAARRWPALATHRSTWLLAQGAVVLAVVLGVLAYAPPALPRMHAFAPIMIDMAASHADAGTAAATALIMPPGSNTPTSHVPSTPRQQPARATGDRAAPRVFWRPIDWRAIDWPSIDWLPTAWLAVYLAGLAWHAARRLRASRRWHVHLERHSAALPPARLADTFAVTPAQCERIAGARLRIRTTALPMSPVLLGGRRPCLVLPTHLTLLAAGQQRLIVEHELTHWRRADQRWLALAAIGALLFWFNRPYARLVDGLREAVELGCDDAVLAGRSQRERQGYAAALVAQLKLERAQMQVHLAPAFGELGIAGRVLRMRAPCPPRLSGRGRLTCAAAALGLALAGAALQPAFSAMAPAVPMRSVPAQTTASETWQYPIAHPRVTSLYGVRSDLLPQGHHGVDFAARRGTPVLAVARGTVVEAGANPTWGNYVRIDHGGGRSSLAIHLDHASVAPGRQVRAGDTIGAAGASGRATGPHLHFEYWQDGRRLDPALMLADLSSYATAHARARRRDQDHPVPLDR